MIQFQHCKPAVDEEAFMKLVDKQYELLKKERSKPQEDSKEPPVANGTTEPTNNFPQQNGQPEVIHCLMLFFFV